MGSTEQGCRERQERAYGMRQIVLGKSVQGASHIRSGMECQDSNKRVILEDGTILLAVADGHGSKGCPYSKTGSRIAVNVFCDIVREVYESYQANPEQLPTYLNREGDIAIAKAIDAEWKRRVTERHRKNKREVSKREDGSNEVNDIYRQYGTTLLGLLVAKTFIFAFQLGDGDICAVIDGSVDRIIESEKILGVETHSLSSEKSWGKAITSVRRIDIGEQLPILFTLSTDGYANSYKSEGDFQKAISDYYELLHQHGAKAVEDALPGWLAETSEMGCGDDITMMMAYFAADEAAASEESTEGD